MVATLRNWWLFNRNEIMVETGKYKFYMFVMFEGCHYSTARHGTARHIPEQFNTLFFGTEQLFNINLLLLVW